jgi:mono/diheme cytochrome c family protein
MTNYTRILALAAGLLVAGAAGYSQTPAPQPTDSVAHGKDLFVQYTCYGCHGFSGQNGNGARLVPMKFPQAGFIAYVRNPPRANQMPSYSPKVLPDRDLADIYAYIRSLPDSAPSPASVPVLRDILSENK